MSNVAGKTVYDETFSSHLATVTLMVTGVTVTSHDLEGKDEDG